MKATDDTNARRCGLGEIALVQPGYLSRTCVRSLPTGTHRLLQARDISRQNGLRPDTTIRFKPERNPDLYRVSRGDILLAARGQDHHAHLIDVDLSDVLASSIFYIIRPHEGIVLPRYLAWCLNQLDVQATLESASRGTGIGYIARPTMEHLPIMVPSIKVQTRIAETIDLWRRQQSLQARLDQKREQLIQSICRQFSRHEKE